MKHYLTFLIVCMAIKVNGDSWVQKASFPGIGRGFSFGFTIGNNGYVGCGVNDSAALRYKDFWEFNPSTNVWIQKADFAGGKRKGAIGFAIGNKGYAGIGEDSSSVRQQDFWEYDPSMNVWNQKSNFGGGERAFAVGFSINNKGYIGLGIGIGAVSNLWEYDPVTNSWAQKSNYGATLLGANSFTIGNKGYVVGGYDYVAGGAPSNAVWEYDAIADSITIKASLPVPFWEGRFKGAAFSMCGKGYFGTGNSGPGGTVFNNFWEYDPVLNQWTQKTNFAGVIRMAGVGFSIGNKGYIGFGNDISYFHSYNDIWEYTPDSPCATDVSDLASTLSNFTIYPNPAKDEFKVCGLKFQVDNSIEIKVFDSYGKMVLSKYITNPKQTIHCKQLPTGIYFVQAGEGENKVVRKMVVE